MDEAGQSRTSVGVRAPSGQLRLLCDHEPPGIAGGGGIVDPGTIADRADAIRARDLGGVHVENRGALELVQEWAPRLGARARIYLDPPYQHATGYPAACSRDEVLAICEESARHGGLVVCSEAVSLAAELGRGWTATRLAGQREGERQEWVTSYGCDVGALLPPLLRAMGA